MALTFYIQTKDRGGSEDKAHFVRYGVDNIRQGRLAISQAFLSALAQALVFPTASDPQVGQGLSSRPAPEPAKRKERA